MAKKKARSAGQTQTTPQRILSAANDLFLANGFRETSLDDVATLAGVTKPTVYSHFGSKQGLLITLVRERISENATVLSDILRGSGDVESDLLHFGKIFLSRTQSKEAARWRRLAFAESIEHPEIGVSIHAAGPAIVGKAMVAFMKQETKAGRLCCDDPEMAAEQFLGLLLGLGPIHEIIGKPPPGKAKQGRICRAAVRTFLAAYQSKRRGAKS
ncbi:MAG: TetR/AcrR family transcriptional regulator [Planctomycetota bacterium]